MDVIAVNLTRRLLNNSKFHWFYSLSAAVLTMTWIFYVTATMFFYLVITYNQLMDTVLTFLVQKKTFHEFLLSSFCFLSWVAFTFFTAFTVTAAHFEMKGEDSWLVSFWIVELASIAVKISYLEEYLENWNKILIIFSVSLDLAFWIAVFLKFLLETIARKPTRNLESHEMGALR